MDDKELTIKTIKNSQTKQKMNVSVDVRCQSFTGQLKVVATEFGVAWIKLFALGQFFHECRSTNPYGLLRELQGGCDLMET